MCAVNLTLKSLFITDVAGTSLADQSIVHNTLHTHIAASPKKSHAIFLGAPL